MTSGSGELAIELTEKSNLDHLDWNCCRLSNAAYPILLSFEVGLKSPPPRHGASCQEARHGAGRAPMRPQSAQRPVVPDAIIRHVPCQTGLLTVRFPCFEVTAHGNESERIAFHHPGATDW